MQEIGKCTTLRILVWGEKTVTDTEGSASAVNG